jgi:hypothetical protein
VRFIFPIFENQIYPVMKKSIFCFLLFAFSLSLYAQEVNIIPKPVIAELGKPNTFFKLNNTTQIYISNDSLKHRRIFSITISKNITALAFLPQLLYLSIKKT